MVLSTITTHHPLWGEPPQPAGGGREWSGRGREGGINGLAPIFLRTTERTALLLFLLFLLLLLLLSIADRKYVHATVRRQRRPDPVSVKVSRGCREHKPVVSCFCITNSRSADALHFVRATPHSTECQAAIAREGSLTISSSSSPAAAAARTQLGPTTQTQ